ncbi:hypothetical protein F511_22242 [Dorcoceras hygrometricum]|uniref:Uncharacterized protein n=1 Tax=Dorcoceras hygrometricum TaxID=472368 RepID=A0A2Z7C4G4_9LAMI|nr:hypothetical protein F511_22242 [Dorcoceras hygrometricum]
MSRYPSYCSPNLIFSDCRWKTALIEVRAGILLLRRFVLYSFWKLMPSLERLRDISLL